jgi:phosphoglucosamine mutase
MSQNKKSLEQLLVSVSIYPQVLLNVKFKSGYDWTADKVLQKQIAQVESDLKTTGRVLIRASGTEPLVRVMIETSNADIAMAAAKSIAELIPTA